MSDSDAKRSPKWKTCKHEKWDEGSFLLDYCDGCGHTHESLKDWAEIDRLERLISWQPIETAPQIEFERILSSDGENVFISYWTGHAWYSPPVRHEFLTVKYWMPLPELPK